LSIINFSARKMSTPTLTVLGVSAAQESLSILDEKAAAPSSLRLHGRVTVFNQDGSFDMVRIRLQGTVRTRIGTQVATEKTAMSSITKTKFDFQPVYSASRHSTEEQFLDFVCPVPTSSNGVLNTFVPSTTLSGKTYLTKVTALTNRELLEGSCEVVYTLEAAFLQSASKKVVRRISCPVDISSSLTPLDVQVTSSGSSEMIEERAKPQQRSLGRFLGSQSQLEVSVELPKNLGTIISDLSTASTGCRRLTVPISVNVSIPSNLRRHAQSMLEKDGLKCLVSAQWFARRTFTTGSSAVESTIHNDRVSSQQYSLPLPPLYKSSSDSSKYTTLLLADLLIPESMVTPTVSTTLLGIGYTLDLTMKIEAGNKDTLKSPYTASISLPVTLQPASVDSMINRRIMDAVLGSMEEQSLFAPPPYVY
jgi:hypothetical protein